MAEKIEEWMKDSWMFQQDMYKHFGKREWDSLDENGNNLMRKLVMPFEFRFGETYQSNPRCKKITDRVETRLLDLFRDNNYNQNFDYTFINLKKIDDKEDEEIITCVFWLQSESGLVRCVDLDGRVYKSWDDFINNNRFSKYYMIYPKGGRYYQPGNEDFADIILEESVACGARRSVKNLFDAITTVGGIVATGVLVCNPVSGPLILGATAVAAASGVYSAGTNIHRLVDIQKHEGGLSLEKSNTLLTVGELAINVVGTAAIGVSAGIKGLAATTGKVLSEGSIAFRVANSFSKVTKFVSYFSGSYNLIVAIYNCSVNGQINMKDIAAISKRLFYGFNVFASDSLISKLIRFLADNVPVERVIDYFIISFYRRATEVVRKCYKFCSENDLFDLIELILPNCIKLHVPNYIKLTVPNCVNPSDSNSIELPVPSLLTNTVSVVKQIPIIVNEHSASSSKRLLISDNDKKISIEDAMKIKELEDEIKRKRNEDKIKRRFDKQTCDILKKWTEDNGIDLFADSRFDNIIYTLDEFEEKIKETVKICCKNVEPDNLKQKEKLLLDLCLDQIKSELLEDNRGPISKMNFFCNAFELIFEDHMKHCYYKYFYHFHKKNGNMAKSLFFHKYYDTDNIHELNFKRSIRFFVLNIRNLREKYEQFNNRLTK